MLAVLNLRPLKVPLEVAFDFIESFVGGASIAVILELEWVESGEWSWLELELELWKTDGWRVGNGVFLTKDWEGREVSVRSE